MTFCLRQGRLLESGRSEDGYRAVLCVVLNRVESSKWPNNVNDVVYQKSQFSVVSRSDFSDKNDSGQRDWLCQIVFNNGKPPAGDECDFIPSAAVRRQDLGTRTYVGTYGGNDFYS
jgi:hypothetical protein